MGDDIKEKIDSFFASYKKRTYPKGQILIYAKDPSEYVYQLLEGKIKVYTVSYRGDEVIVNVFKPPAFFPISLAINESDNPFYYETESEVVLRAAPNSDVVTFLKENPDVTFDLLQRVYRGTDGLLDRIVHLMSGTAKSRLLYELLIESLRFGVITENEVTITLSEVELAARAGLSRETVSREIHKLKEHGMVSLQNKNIVIHDFEKLRHDLGKDF